ncbi:MAG: ribonuclease Z [Deltaproteobacteria bacterium]|nr:ribonuclease Z [Deltaproteobacteria bacterium]MBW2130450.1 ribonuclease Z [Deltaproteobacteria bacterium]MBW2303583.1 ribonuclease Z [Deltaproteobacteria bacterium]
MELIVLGSGTGFPLPDRGSPSMVLLHGAGCMLFDMGPGALRQLTRAGLDYKTIHHIFFTHFHPDHTGDLVHFLFATRHPSTLSSRAPFGITAPKGFVEFLHRLQEAYPKWLELPPNLMRIEERDTDNRETGTLGDLTVISHPVKHTPHSIAYRVEDPDGRSFVYSGDTDYCEGLVDLARDTDILFLECSFPDQSPVEGHLHPLTAGRIASLAQAKKLVLLHFYPEVLSTEIGTQCRQTYDGELILARDFLRLTV